MTTTERLNLALRAVMEMGIVAGLAYWGVHVGASTGAKIVLGVGVPAVGFGFWGAIDFHQLGRYAEPARLVQELVVSGLSAAAWYGAGQPVIGIALGALSLIYHASVYASGQHLLNPRPAARSRRSSTLRAPR